MKIINYLLKIINQIDDYFCAFLLSVMTIIIFVQVIFRYLLNNSISWSEELAIYMFAWISFLGAASLAKKGHHFSFDNIVVLLPEKAKIIIEMFSDICSCLFITFFTISGYKLVVHGSDSLTGSLGISMKLPFLALPIAGVLYFIRVLIMLINKIINISRGNNE